MMSLNGGSRTSRHSSAPYFESAGNTHRGPYYPVDAFTNIYLGSGHMPLQMPKEEDFRAAHLPEEHQIVEGDLTGDITPKSYHHIDLEDSPRSRRNSGVVPRKRVASTTSVSPEGGPQPIGSIRNAKKLPWPSDDEDAYMPIGPDESLLDDYYLPNETFPFLGLDRSYEEDLFSPTEPEQAENPYAYMSYPEPLPSEKKQTYVPYRPGIATTPQQETERPYSVSSVGSRYYGYSGYTFDKRALEEGIMTPVSNYSGTSKDDSNTQPVLRKPVPKKSGSLSRPNSRRQGSFISSIGPDDRVPPVPPVPPIPVQDLYSPPATPPVPPPVPPKHNISPVDTQVTICDISKLEPEVRMTATVGPGNNSWPTIPTDNPYIDASDSRQARIPPVPMLVPKVVPKRKKWWKRIFSWGRSSA